MSKKEGYYANGNGNKKVINVETGEVYKSLKDAAKVVDMSYVCLSNRLNGIVANNETSLEWLEKKRENN